ncbi:MAG: GNAT family N-acetyltransferase [Chromatiales bacterium]|nr:GNAT family N-acetyltransferase [Chromatiales bacterium]
MTNKQFTIAVANWPKDSKALKQIRREVFIKEQSVPEALEWDGLDESALHLIATSESGQTIGTARLLSDSHIGRVAVVKRWRGHGVGSTLIREMIYQAELLGYRELKLAAQIQALPFYERLGFVAYGDEFMDANIPHLNMRKYIG